MTVGEKILMLRKKQGLSQEAMAEKLGVSRQAVCRWEGGSAQPDASNLRQLSKLFGVTADYLLNEEEDGAVLQSGESPHPRFPGRAGCILAAVGLLGEGGLYLLSRFVKVMAPLREFDPATGRTLLHYDNIPRIDYRFFIGEYKLWAVVILLWLLTAAGLVLWLINSPAVKRQIRKFGEKSPSELAYDAIREGKNK